MTPGRYSYAIRVKDVNNGSIKLAYPRATYPAAVRAYEREIAAHKPKDFTFPYSAPTRNTIRQSVRLGRYNVEYERLDR